MYIISYIKMKNGSCPLLHDGSKSVEFESLERAYEFYTDECRLTEFCNKKMGGAREHTSLVLYEDDGVHPSIVQEIDFYK